ncbi:phosphatidylinositol kinase [Acidobacteria bacterium AB60]|nr:phosphatidylinositol kinase [Acidobacteria bacterium AB60]
MQGHRRESGLAIVAVQHIRRMRGGAQGQLMLGADGHVYVVKFQNNPQHVRVLANELLATRLAAAAGLTAPHAELMEVSEWLIANTPELEMDLGRRRERCRAGLQFGSRFVGGLMPGQVVDFLPEEQLGEVKNAAEFAGILALDKWTGNANGRQAVFARKQRERRYRAVFIDYGYCFHAGDWTFEDVPLRGVYYRNAVYRGVTGWASFEPWLSRMETMAEETAWAAANEIPPEWYGGDVSALEALVEKLLQRRTRIRELIEEFRRSDRAPFPNWGKGREEIERGAWEESQDGGRMRVN